MAYVLDLAVILIFVLTIIRGYKIGFVDSVISFVGMIVAVVLAFTLSGPIANGIYSAFVQKPTENAIVTSIDEVTGENEAGANSLTENLQAAQESLPGFVKSLMEKNSISLTEIAENVEGGIENTAKAIAETVTEQVVKPVVTLLIRCIVGVVLLIALLIGASLLVKVVSKVLRITPLKKLDGILGAVLGALKGLLWVLLVVTIMQMIAGFTAEDAVISKKAIEESIVVSRVADINPIYSDKNVLIVEFNELMKK